jgi:hypothetical protein
MSEGGRLSQKLESIRRGCGNAALAAARAYYGGEPCGPCGGPAKDPLQFVPLSSDYLTLKQDQVLACPGAVVRAGVPPQSVRIQEIITSNLDQSVNPLNPDARFSEYRGPFIPPVCPPVPLVDRNANIPKASTRCPLPNKGYMPNLPA